MALEKAGVELVAQGAGGFSADMRKASHSIGAFGEIATGALRHIGTLAVDAFMAAGRAAVDFAGDSITAARDTARLMASTEQTIKSMGNAAGRSAKQVADMATALSDASGKSLFGDDQIQQSENLLLTFGNIKGETFDLATALTVDLAQALGGAPKDQAMMLGKALQDPIKGITALGKAGLTFSAEQKEMIKSMVESGDVAGAQALIIEELNKQVGGQAEAAAKAAGGMVQFKARMGEVGENIATSLLPILNQFGDFLNTTIAPAIEKAAAALSAWLADPAVQQGIKDITETIGTGLSTAFSFLTDTAIPAFTKAWTDIQPALATASAILKDVAGAVGGGIRDGLQWLNETGIPGAKKVWDDAQPSLTAIKGVFSDIGDAVGGAIKDGLVWLTGTGIPGIGTAWDNVKASANDILVWLRDDLPGAIGTSKSDFKQWKEDVQSNIDATKKGFDQWGADIQSNIDGTKKGFAQWGSDIQSNLDGTKAGFANWYADVRSNFVGLGVDMDKWESDVKSNADAVQKFFGDLQVNVQKDLGLTSGNLDTSSMSFTQWKADVQSNVDATTRIFNQWKADVQSNIDATVRIFTQWKADVQSNIDGVAAAFTQWKADVQSNIDATVAGFQAMPGQVAGVGAAIVASIRDGFESAWNSFLSWWNDQLQAFRNSLPFSEPKDPSSPLRGLAKSGRAMVDMMQTGMDSAGPLNINGLVSSSASPSALMRGGSTTTNSSTYSPTINYAPTYGRAPRAPAMDIAAMTAWGI